MLSLSQALGSLIVVGFLWKLPDHVFGTAKYQYNPGKFPKGQVYTHSNEGLKAEFVLTCYF
jgi:hypothetical protein